MPLSEIFAEWITDQAHSLQQERVQIYDERKSFPDLTFLEFPLGEVPNELGSQWAKRFQTTLSTSSRQSQDLLMPLTRSLKIAEIPIIYDKVFDFTAIVLDVISSDAYKNMADWFFCAVADDTGGSLLAINSAHLPDPVTEFLQKYRLSLEDCMKPGTIIQVRNAKSFPLRGVGALSFTRTSTLQLLGHDMYSHLVNFVYRDGQKSI